MSGKSDVWKENEFIGDPPPGYESWAQWMSGPVHHGARITSRYNPDSPKEAPKAETILEEAQRLVMGDRQQDYGSPYTDFSGTAEMLSGFLRDKLTKPITAEEVGLMMVIVKLSRLRNSLKRDSLVDLAGYAQTVQMVRDERERRAKEAEADMQDFRVPDCSHQKAG